MAEIFLMKTMKLLLTFLCYSSFGIIFINKQLDGAVLDNLSISPELQNIIIYLFIILWILKIVWFVIDKAIQAKERWQKIKEIDHKHKEEEK